jgi:hypothetical protein
MDMIHQRLRKGILAGEQVTPGAPWRIVLSDEVRRKLSGGDAPEGWVSLGDAARRLGLSKSHVVYLIKTGRLEAMQTAIVSFGVGESIWTRQHVGDKKKCSEIPQVATGP